MAIIKKFSGKNFSIPGVYSKLNVQTSTGTVLPSEGTLLIMGTASNGKGGKEDGIKSWDAIDRNALKAYYGSGDLVDAAFAATDSPGAGIGGASRILTYKINSHTRRKSGTVQLGEFRAKSYGKTPKYEVSLSGKTIEVKLLDKVIEELELKQKYALKIINTHSQNTPAVTITYDANDRKILTIGSNAAIILEDKTLEDVRDEVRALDDLDADIDVSRGFKPATILDAVATSVLTIAADGVGELKANRQEMIDVLKDRSSYIEYKEDKSKKPLVATIFDGVTILENKTTVTPAKKSSLQAGFEEALNQDFALVTLAFSQALGDDISLKDSHDMLKAHLALRGNEKNGKEAQAIIGVRTQTLDTDFDLISQIADPSIQAVCQEVTKLDTSEGRSIKGPHILAAMLCAVRLGTPIGTPLTRKPIGALLVQHRLKDDDGAIVSVDAFNTSLKGEEAIRAGVTYIEERRSVFVCALDNTTYVC